MLSTNVLLFIYAIVALFAYLKDEGTFKLFRN